jgi:exodeoxyribonuclease VII large subunit
MDDAPRPQLTNIPEYTVSEIAGQIKRLLEGEFARVRVRGEITELKTYSSGHVYFCLKDEGGKLRAILWKSAAHRVPLVPENGVEVVATGRISSYADRSEYQLIVDRLEYAGVGAQLARIEALRQRLVAEGLFDAARKRPLPLVPDVVGVVTSPQGAVLQDIRTTIARRFPRRVLVWPVQVQGELAAQQVARAIAGFNALAPHGPVPRPDVLIVARGGGSLEDLMAFNDEAVVRAAVASAIPLVSAIGHETDTTLIDFAADRRAPTPTAAAELVVPAAAELAAGLDQHGARITGALARLLQEQRLRLAPAQRLPSDLVALVETLRQRLDDRVHRLGVAMPNRLRDRRAALVQVDRHLLHPRPQVDAARGALAFAAARVYTAVRARLLAGATAAERVASRLTPDRLAGALRHGRMQVDALAARLDSVSHHAVLARGYVAVFDTQDRPVTRRAAVRPGMTLKLEFADGTARAKATDDAKTTSGQGALPL